MPSATGSNGISSIERVLSAPVFYFLLLSLISNSAAISVIYGYGGAGGESEFSASFHLDKSACLLDEAILSDTVISTDTSLEGSGNNKISQTASNPTATASTSISSEGDLVSWASIYASRSFFSLSQGTRAAGSSELSISASSNSGRGSEKSGVLNGSLASSQMASAVGDEIRIGQITSICGALGYINGEAQSLDNEVAITGGLNGIGAATGIIATTVSNEASASGSIQIESDESKAYAAAKAISNDNSAFSYISSDRRLESSLNASATGSVNISQNDINTNGRTLIYAQASSGEISRYHEAESEKEVAGNITASSGNPIMIGINLKGDVMSSSKSNSPIPGSWVWDSFSGYLNSNPFILRDNYGQRHIFVQGGDGSLYDNLDGDWRALGGQISSDPYAINVDTKIHVFAKGRTNSLTDCIVDIAKEESSWRDLSGVITSAPRAINTPGRSTIKIAVTGIDNALWINELDTGKLMGSWNYLGGYVTSNPEPIYDSQGRLHVFASGADKALWDNTDGAWRYLGGVVTSDARPIISPTSPEHILTYVRGGDGSLMYNDLNTATGEAAWLGLGGYIPGKVDMSLYEGNPAPVADDGGIVHVFVRGGDGALWDNANRNWKRYGGVLSSDPHGINSDGLLEVASRGIDGSLFLAAPEVYGANPNPTGNPIGGGAGYKKTISRSEANIVVNSSQGLASALGSAKFGDIIYIDDNALIDLTDYGTMVIPEGVTLASGRGTGGSKGALIYTKKLYSTPNTVKEDPIMLETGGQGVRVTGIRLQGPDPNVGTNPYGTSIGVGINVKYAKTEVDNCELWGWSHAAVKLDGRYQPAFANVHHNYIHNNQKTGWGYGVSLKEGTVQASIKGNLFDYNRHSVTGWGVPQTRYEAAYNIQGPHAVSSPFDMHGGEDRRDGTNIAGDWMKVHHNTVQYTGTASSVVVRGIPVTGAWINNNWFFNDNTQADAVQLYGIGHFYDYNNLFGM